MPEGENTAWFALCKLSSLTFLIELDNLLIPRGNLQCNNDNYLVSFLLRSLDAL